MYCVGVWDSQFTLQFFFLFFFRLLPKSLKWKRSYNDRLTDHLIAGPFCGNPEPQLVEMKTLLRNIKVAILHRKPNIDFDISYLTSISSGLSIKTKQMLCRSLLESEREPEPSTILSWSGTIYQWEESPDITFKLFWLKSGLTSLLFINLTAAAIPKSENVLDLCLRHC